MTGAVAELFIEVVMPLLDYKDARKWQAEYVGREYIDAMQKGRNA